MESSSAPTCFDIFEFYRQYCEITSAAYARGSEGFMSDSESHNGRFSRGTLNQLLTLVESRSNARISVSEEIYKLLLRLDLPAADFSEFSRFYDFVFFLCRENGQKNISVRRAVMAWKLVLAGRFQLLNEWCDFVEKYQRYSISEDTWRQVLPFVRSVHDDNLEWYNAEEGAGPVLIDEFVEHMYSSRPCNRGDSDARPLDEDSLSELPDLPGSKRKFYDNLEEYNAGHHGFKISKRRQICSPGTHVHREENPSCCSNVADCSEMFKQNCSLT